jgi:hypothetical protein
LRHDVGDSLREDVGTFLIEQTGGFAGGFGLLIDLLRLFASLYAAHNAPLADCHRHGIHGSAFGKRKCIHRLDRHFCLCSRTAASP